MSQKLSVCEAPGGEAEKQSNTCSTQLLTATNGKDRHGWGSEPSTLWWLRKEVHRGVIFTAGYRLKKIPIEAIVWI